MNESRGQRGRIVIWRICDGRPGHDTQSQGLQQALAAMTPCDCRELDAQSLSNTLMQLLCARFPAGVDLPDPDFIIGAGHGTHLTLLAASRARGGKTVVLMKPSLPTRLFDYCLIPAHDLPPQSQNIFVTQGVLNRATPSREQVPDEGLILVGGPSRHYDWDAPALMRQIREVRAGDADIHWLITDSPRTPAATRELLAGEFIPERECVAHESTAPDWLTQVLRRAAFVWVTEDSISMICEALTTGAAVGVLSVPVKRRGRITRAVDDMVKTGLITRFQDWQTGAPLRPADPPLHEAARCARILMEKSGLI